MPEINQYEFVQVVENNHLYKVYVNHIHTHTPINFTSRYEKRDLIKSNAKETVLHELL